MGSSTDISLNHTQVGNENAELNPSVIVDTSSKHLEEWKPRFPIENEAINEGLPTKIPSPDIFHEQSTMDLPNNKSDNVGQSTFSKGIYEDTPTVSYPLPINWTPPESIGGNPGEGLNQHMSISSMVSSAKVDMNKCDSNELLTSTQTGIFKQLGENGSDPSHNHLSWNISDIIKNNSTEHLEFNTSDSLVAKNDAVKTAPEDSLPEKLKGDRLDREGSTTFEEKSEKTIKSLKSTAVIPDRIPLLLTPLPSAGMPKIPQTSEGLIVAAKLLDDDLRIMHLKGFPDSFDSDAAEGIIDNQLDFKALEILGESVFDEDCPAVDNGIVDDAKLQKLFYVDKPNIRNKIKNTLTSQNMRASLVGPDFEHNLKILMVSLKRRYGTVTAIQQHILDCSLDENSIERILLTLPERDTKKWTGWLQAASRIRHALDSGLSRELTCEEQFLLMTSRVNNIHRRLEWTNLMTSFMLCCKALHEPMQRKAASVEVLWKNKNGIKAFFQEMLSLLRWCRAGRREKNISWYRWTELLSKFKVYYARAKDGRPNREYSILHYWRDHTKPPYIMSSEDWSILCAGKEPPMGEIGSKCIRLLNAYNEICKYEGEALMEKHGMYEESGEVNPNDKFGEKVVELRESCGADIKILFNGLKKLVAGIHFTALWLGDPEEFIPVIALTDSTPDLIKTFVSHLSLLIKWGTDDMNKTKKLGYSSRDHGIMNAEPKRHPIHSYKRVHSNLPQAGLKNDHFQGKRQEPKRHKTMTKEVTEENDGDKNESNISKSEEIAETDRRRRRSSAGIVNEMARVLQCRKVQHSSNAFDLL